MIEKEVRLLEEIKKAPPHVPQRELAKRSGLSLGMTNHVIKKLLEEGLLRLKRLNGRTIDYHLTSKGLEKLARRSMRFVRKTIGNIKIIGERIHRLIAGIQEQGYQGVVLIGDSELDFLVEKHCRELGLEYRKANEIVEEAGYFSLIGESADEQEALEVPTLLHSIIHDESDPLVLEN